MENETIEAVETEEVVEGGNDYDYTPEELAMFQKNEVVEEVEEAEEAEEVIEEEASNPWDWVGDEDPAKIRKTYETFTKKTQELAEERKRLEEEYAPAQEFLTQVSNDPKLVALIQAYYAQEKTPLDEVADLKMELNRMKQETSIKQEVQETLQWIKSEDLPVVDERDLLDYAAKHRSPSLQAAYRDMKFDEIREQEREKTLQEVKKNKGAAVPNINKGGKTSSALTQKEIDNMSNEEMEKRYAEVQEFYAKQQK